jgi:hypothetical protein
MSGTEDTRHVLVDIHRGKDLKNVQVFGEQMPYIRASISTSMRGSVPTPPSQTGGVNPVWRDARLCLDTTGCAGDVSILLEIYDPGIVQDELIGKTEIWMDERMKFEETNWYDVDSGGQIECTITMNKQESLLSGKTVYIEVHAVNEIMNVQYFSEQKPYVQALVMPGRLISCRTKSVDKGGGVDAIFDRSQENYLAIPVEQDTDAILLEIISENTVVADEVIGFVELPLDYIKMQLGNRVKQKVCGKQIVEPASSFIESNIRIFVSGEHRGKPRVHHQNGRVR